MNRIISFLGLERCDLVLYLAGIYNSIKMSTLVIDNSYSKDLYYAINKGEDYEVERGYVTYVQDLDYSKEVFNGFDCVIFYEGLNPNSINIAASDILFIVSDYTEAVIRQIRGFYECDIKKGLDLAEKTHGKELKMYCILRDKISRKISDKLVCSMLGCSKSEFAGSLLFCEEDYRRYIDLGFNSNNKIQGCSKELKEALTFIFAHTEEIDYPAARKIVRKA